MQGDGEETGSGVLPEFVEWLGCVCVESGHPIFHVQVGGSAHFYSFAKGAKGRGIGAHFVGGVLSGIQ